MVEPRAFLEDVRFSLAHFRDIERAALVGDHGWLGPYARVADALFPCETRAFATGQLEPAWAWLRSGEADLPTTGPPPWEERHRRESSGEGASRTIAAKDALIPVLGFGTWKLEGETCTARVADALSAGYRHVDTAKRYENHEAVGAGLARSGVDREEVFLTSKVWYGDLTRDRLLASTEEGLKELRTDYLDLLLVHWPNPQIPLEETLGAMLELREQERVRHLGVSNFPPSWVEEALALAPVVCDQVEYHPLLSQNALLDTLRANDMALVAYSPLAHGEGLDLPELEEIARAHDRTPAEVSLRWLLSQDGVAAIPKAASREHLEQNLRVFEFELDAEEMRRIHDLAEREGERTVAPDFAPRWERGDADGRS